MLNDLLRRILFLPEQASTISRSVDHLHFFVIITTMIASTACGLTALLLFVKYRRRREGERTPVVNPTTLFEATAVCVPLSFFLAWWLIGFKGYVRMATPPPNAMDVYVTAKQWMWKFSYAGGPNSIEVLHVPAGRPVRLLMTSRDVIHSFYVPSFRIKQDVLPGRYTQTWFEAVAPGRYQILCAEYCGLGHSQMWGEVIAHPPEEFENWLETQRAGLTARRDLGRDVGGEAMRSDVGEDAGRYLDAPVESDLVEQGRRVAMEAGCFKCHTIDGSAHIGPTFLDLYQRRERLDNGVTVTADEGYLTESMMDPLAKVVAGYKPVMPTFQGRLGPPEIAALLEFIRSLRTVPVTHQPSGRQVYEPATSR
jgi:cytochrome c oxidase subunit 2